MCYIWCWHNLFVCFLFVCDIFLYLLIFFVRRIYFYIIHCDIKIKVFKIYILLFIIFIYPFTCCSWFQSDITISNWLVGLVYGAFNNIPVISWRLVLLVEETGIPRENHRPVASHWQTLSLNVVSSAPRHEHDSSSQLGGSLSKLCPTAPLSIQDDCCY